MVGPVEGWDDCDGGGGEGEDGEGEGKGEGEGEGAGLAVPEEEECVGGSQVGDVEVHEEEEEEEEEEEARDDDDGVVGHDSSAPPPHPNRASRSAVSSRMPCASASQSLCDARSRADLVSSPAAWLVYAWIAFRRPATDMPVLSATF